MNTSPVSSFSFCTRLNASEPGGAAVEPSLSLKEELYKPSVYIKQCYSDHAAREMFKKRRNIGSYAVFDSDKPGYSSFAYQYESDQFRHSLFYLDKGADGTFSMVLVGKNGTEFDRFYSFESLRQKLRLTRSLLECPHSEPSESGNFYLRPEPRKASPTEEKNSPQESFVKFEPHGVWKKV